MADRIAGIIALALAVGYGFIAFTIIRAPFQYDPLGPESWPRILSVVAALCCAYIIIRPDKERFVVVQRTIVRIALVIIMLSGYAYFFEPAGFIVSTTLFCAIFAWVLGAGRREALLFGCVTGVAGHFVCVNLLDLNLPAGIFSSIL